jgi:serine/threonine protein kinase
MGEVYVADDRRLGRQVALKFLPPDRRRDADSRARLFREAQAASLLQSPHIAVTYDLVEHEDSMFIAMEYVDGELISERVARGPLPVPEALDIAAQVAEALDEAHGRGVTHRDIKSANLIQTRRGLVKVLDFGLAKLDVPASVEANLLTQPDILVTAPGMVLGTIAYMAPEQLRGDAVDQRVDLWALGVVLYEMLAGKLPFRGNTLAVVFSARSRRRSRSSIRRFRSTSNTWSVARCRKRRCRATTPRATCTMPCATRPDGSRRVDARLESSLFMWKPASARSPS